MRFLILVFAILASILALAWTAAIEQTVPVNNAATTLLEVDSETGHESEDVRQTRQFFGGFHRPYYGYYGGYYHPYHGFGYYRPYYGLYRPYYGGYGFFG